MQPIFWLSVFGENLLAFRLSNGEYVISHESASFAIGKGVASVQDFLTSEKGLILLSRTSAPRFVEVHTSATEPDLIERIEVIPLSLVNVYWFLQAVADNETAMTLTLCCMEENLQSKADIAFKEAQAP